jgi:hypothetical protein
VTPLLQFTGDLLPGSGSGISFRVFDLSSFFHEGLWCNLATLI